jgi:S1-C subfamily serine protease
MTARNILTTIAISALTSFLIVSVTLTRLAAPNPTSTSTGATATLPTSTIVAEESAIETAVKNTEPAVVSVIISKDLPVLQRYYEEGPFGLRIPQFREGGTVRREIGGGTAFFISNDGILMTNKHVVADPAAEYTVLLNDGRKVTARVLGRDPVNDIALIKIPGANYPFLHLAGNEPLQLGQMAIAIGNALGEFRNTVSVGVISGLQRSITAGSSLGGSLEQLTSIIQTDAAINEGNSGGPLLNIQGVVIGMNTATAAGAQNIGFAIPARDLEKVLASYQKYGRIVRPYLGVRYVPITKALQEQQKLAYDYGVLVSKGANDPDAVLPGSPAEKAGIKEGDIILEADGKKLTPDTSLANIIQTKNPGDTLQLKLVRNGNVRDVAARLEEWKESNSSASP